MRLDRSIVIALLALLATTAAAQSVPTVVNYQARLTDNSPGQSPIDGSLAVDFRIYGTPTGSDLLWSESWSAVAVTDGLLNVLLGSNGSPLDTSIFVDPGERWLEVEIEGEILAPRQRMGSAPFAQRSAITSDLAFACADGQVLKSVDGEWACSDPTSCPVGSSVACYDGPVGTLDVGACSAGTAACNGAGYESCAGQVLPAIEQCNGADDNCDGATDESFPEQGGACTVGIGACESTGEFVCPAGTLDCDAVAGTPQAETCNDVDDDCNGTPDDNLPGDGFEPNQSCGAAVFLGTLGSDQVVSFSNASVYPAGDADYFRWNLTETDGTCGCGGFPATDEDYRFHATVTVPAGAGAYQVCVSADVCGGFSCTTVGAGGTGSVSIPLDGSCSATDSYTGYVRVNGLGAPGFECLPYTLQVRFEAGLCL